MSSTGSTLLSTIKSDLENAASDFVTEAEATGLVIWNIVKTAFLVATSEQAQTIIDVFNKLEEDETAGKSLEDIETDMLQTASADELVILKQAGSTIIQGFIAFIAASRTASAAVAA